MADRSYALQAWLKTLSGNDRNTAARNFLRTYHSVTAGTNADDLTTLLSRTSTAELQAFAGPRNISGLQLWLKADAITGLADGANVTSWADASGNGFDATEATNPPTYETDVINGRPVVRYDNTDVLLLPSAALGMLNGKTGITALAVVVPNDTGTNHNIVHISRADNLGNRFAFALNMAVGTRAHRFRVRFPNDTNEAVASGNTDSLTVGTAVLVSGVGNLTAGTVQSWVNGALQTDAPSITAGTFPATDSQVIAVGARSQLDAQLNGDLAELMVFDVPVSTTLVRAMSAGLCHKYGLTLA